jgi:hypothetical protein
LVKAHLERFVRFASARSGRPLRRYVVEEFRAYLRCGVLAHGFARARCEGCGHERLVAFSCKLRGVCPSCGGRRMSATAADVIDRVLPGGAAAAVGVERPLRAAGAPGGRSGDAQRGVARALGGDAALVPGDERTDDG